MRENKRIEWIDSAKGIAILFVMLGHTHLATPITTWIYSFHIPLFFLISGFTFSVWKYDSITFIKRKVNSLLIPALAYSVIIFAYNFAVGKAEFSIRRILICIVSEILQLRGGCSYERSVVFD